MTHPSPGGSTSAGAAPLQTPPPRWACAGRCLHRASRSNYSPTCTCERTATPYSQPAGRTKSIISTFFQSFFLNKMIQLKQSWHHLSRRHKKDLMGCFSTRGTKSLASIILFHTERIFIHLPRWWWVKLGIMISLCIWSPLWLCSSHKAVGSKPRSTLVFYKELCNFLFMHPP